MRKKDNNLAPVVLFVYNRLDHTKKTLQALRNNLLAEESELFIFSDAPKNSEAKAKVDEIRKYIKTVEGFKKVSIVEREKNMGLAASIIDGVTTICNRYGKVIVLEDDLVTSRYFLKFMNEALDFYEDDKKIFSITGFSFSTDFMRFPSDYKKDVYFHIRPMSWSWATWKDRWDSVDWKIEDYDRFIVDRNARKAFNRGGPDLTRMLKAQMEGKLDSWYIRWTYNAYKQNKLTVYPVVSYVNNIGHDNSGVHCSTDENNVFSHHQLSGKEHCVFIENPEPNATIIKNFNRAFKPRYIRKIKQILNTFFNRLKSSLKGANG